MNTLKKCCTQTYFPDRADVQQDTSEDGDTEENFGGTPFMRSVPGRLINTGGDETFRGRQIEAHITAVYECRYFPGVVATMRLLIVAGLFKDQIFNIEYVKVIREQGKIPKQWFYCTQLADT